MAEKHIPEGNCEKKKVRECIGFHHKSWLHTNQIRLIITVILSTCKFIIKLSTLFCKLHLQLRAFNDNIDINHSIHIILRSSSCAFIDVVGQFHLKYNKWNANDSKIIHNRLSDSSTHLTKNSSHTKTLTQCHKVILALASNK